MLTDIDIKKIKSLLSCKKEVFLSATDIVDSDPVLGCYKVAVDQGGKIFQNVGGIWQIVSIGGAGSDTNFTTDNLTATADRTHNFSNNSLTILNLKTFELDTTNGHTIFNMDDSLSRVSIISVADTGASTQAILNPDNIALSVETPTHAGQPTNLVISESGSTIVRNTLVASERAMVVYNDDGSGGASIGSDTTGGFVRIFGSGQQSEFRTANVTATRTWQMPDRDGNIPLVRNLIEINSNYNIVPEDDIIISTGAVPLTIFFDDATLFTGREITIKAKTNNGITLDASSSGIEDPSDSSINNNITLIAPARTFGSILTYKSDGHSWVIVGY